MSDYENDSEIVETDINVDDFCLVMTARLQGFWVVCK
jgi:hypothetical protein